jgi:hypothetical protein
MVVEGFSERRGARPVATDISRVAIVITDGRSQDNVTEPAKAARNLRINMFAIGVTDHVLAAELEAIAGLFVDFLIFLPTKARIFFIKYT